MLRVKEIDRAVDERQVFDFQIDDHYVSPAVRRRDRQ